MSEKTFSNNIKDKLRKAGFFILDLESLGEGIPDCEIIYLERNKGVFLEFKDKNEKLTTAQKAWIKKNSKATVIILEKRSRLGYRITYSHQLDACTPDINSRVIIELFQSILIRGF